MSTIRCDVVVIGAGAAGLMTAITAGQRGRQVQVIDHANKIGKKILMSGGGRCNFTNTGTPRPTSCRPTPTSASRRWPATRPGISSNWSASTASPITKKSWASCSAMSLPSRS
jgi:thioredoxin reductase